MVASVANFKVNADDLRESWLNPVDDDFYFSESENDEESYYQPFKPREVKDQLLQWWQIGKCATWILLEMEKHNNGLFYCMTNSTVERWKRVILAHDRRLTGGKVLSELGELL